MMRDICLGPGIHPGRMGKLGWLQPDAHSGKSAHSASCFLPSHSSQCSSHCYHSSRSSHPSHLRTPHTYNTLPLTHNTPHTYNTLRPDWQLGTASGGEARGAGRVPG